MGTHEKERGLESLLWSIALPGFGHLINGQLLKGFVLIFLEFLINVQSNFNVAILLSFLGKTKQALEVIDHQWLMFYPCLYFFAMWDAYRGAVVKETSPYLFLPFVFSAYSVTIGLMYSSSVHLFGIFPGPVFFPMMAVVPGLLVGFMIRAILLWRRSVES